jgi:hypothetical protein
MSYPEEPLVQGPYGLCRVEVCMMHLVLGFIFRRDDAAARVCSLMFVAY